MFIKFSNYGVSCICRSSYYTAFLTISQFDDLIIETEKVNTSHTDINSKSWVYGYFISMYPYINKTYRKSSNVTITVDNVTTDISFFSRQTCYMDYGVYPLFSSGKSVKKMIELGLKKTKSNVSADEIVKMFGLSKSRVSRAIKCNGHESIRAMAAVGYSFGKKYFFFPWMSQSLFASFHMHVISAIETLTSLGCTVLLPLGK